MQPVYFGLYLFILAHAREYILVQHSICEAELLLVILSAQAVRRGLVDQIRRQAKYVADLPDFVHQKLRERAEVSCGIAVFGGIADVVLGRIAGVDHSGASGQHLSHCIERRHAKPGRKIDHSVPADPVRTADLKQLRAAEQHFLHRLKSAADIEFHIGNPKKFHKLYRVGDIALHTVGHQDADYPVFAQRFCAQRGGDTGVLSSGDADDGFAALAVLLEIVADPLYNFILGLYRIFEHSFLLFYSGLYYSGMVHVPWFQLTVSYHY